MCIIRGYPNMIKTVIFLLLGFVLLIKGADFFVDGSSAVAKLFHIPSLVVGLTIVALGTSLPELSVSVAASMKGSNSLAISNVVGSNIFNLMVVLGASALMNAIPVGKDVLKRDLPFSMICAGLIMVFALLGNGIERGEGIAMVILLVVYIAFLVGKALHNKEEQEEEEKPLALPLAILFIVGGAVAVKFGGDFVVDSAVEIARAFGLSETLIGLTIVACGTSLPELVTSMVAAKKNQLEMALGNCIGSNIFNLLGILGTAAAISPIGMTTENVIDCVILLAFSAFILIYCIARKQLNRLAGALMILMYGGFLYYICVR